MELHSALTALIIPGDPRESHEPPFGLVTLSLLVDGTGRVESLHDLEARGSWGSKGI